MKSEVATDGMGSVRHWLEGRDGILLISHERPDGDAIASVLALFLALRDEGRRVFAYFPIERFSGRYQPLLQDVGQLAGLCLGSDKPPTDGLQGVLCLDTSNWRRAGLPEDFDRRETALSVCNIDHHPDNSRFAEVNWIEPECGATAQMVMWLLRDRGSRMTREIANLLLVGLVADCGGFRFQNTTPAVLRDAAELSEQGAEYSRVIDTLFFNEPYNKIRFKNHLLENAQFAFGSRLLYAVLEPEMLGKFGLQPSDVEDCIDSLRAVSGVEVTCLVQPVDGDVRFSLRSRRLPFNVAEMAHRLGGGGHPLAAGIRLPKTDLSSALESFLGVAAEWFET